MNNEANILLDKIEKDEQKYGGSIFEKNEKVNSSQIKKFSQWIGKYVKNGFPEYIGFINKINGLNYNGLFLYSLDEKCEYNIFENNKTWWYDNKELQQYIFFGDDSISWYCLNIKNGRYCVLDKPSGDLMNEYKTFDEIIIKSLKVSLEIDN